MAAFKLPESIKEGVILRALNHPMSLVDCDWRPLMSVVNRVNLRIFLSLTPAFELVGMGQVFGAALLVQLKRRDCITRKGSLPSGIADEHRMKFCLREER